MITYSAAGFWIDTISGSTPQTRAPGEYFPDLTPPAPPSLRNRFRSGWKAVTAAPHFVMSQAARLVPASMNAALKARAEARDLARNIKRLEDLGSHLLDDIGIEQVAAGVYVMMETDETLAEAQTPEPAVAAFQPERAAPAAKPARRPVRWTFARRAPVALAGAVSP